MNKLRLIKKISSAALIFILVMQLTTAATLNSWNGQTASVTLTSTELKNCRSDGIFGPGKKTYSLIDSQIDTTKILRNSKIIADLNKKKLKPETYFDTKCPFYLSLIHPSKYRDRIAWDVWIHSQVASMKFCLPFTNICISADSSPGTIGFNEWFVTDAWGKVD